MEAVAVGWRRARTSLNEHPFAAEIETLLDGYFLDDRANAKCLLADDLPLPDLQLFARNRDHVLGLADLDVPQRRPKQTRCPESLPLHVEQAHVDVPEH